MTARGSRSTLRTLAPRCRWLVTRSSPSRPTQTTDTWGEPSRLSVVTWAIGPDSMRSLSSVGSAVMPPLTQRSANTAAGETLDEVALEDEEQHHHGDDLDQGEGHRAAVVRAELSLQVQQPDRQGEQLPVLERDERPREVVPRLQQRHEEQ